MSILSTHLVLALLAALLLGACVPRRMVAAPSVPATVVPAAAASNRQEQPQAELSATAGNIHATVPILGQPGESPQVGSASSSTNAGAVHNGAPAVLRPPPAGRLAEVIRPHLAAFEDRIGVVVEHVISGERFEHHGQERFASASLYKVPVAYEVLRQKDNGTLSLDERLVIGSEDTLEAEPGDLTVGDEVTIQQALETMLGDSSNAAAFALLRRVGRPRLNATLVEQGLLGTSVPLLAGEQALPGSEPLDRELAVTTAADMVRLLRLLATEQLLTPSSRAELWRLLEQVEPVDPLRQALPTEVAVRAKTGNLPGTSNITGLIDTRQGPVLITVLTEDVDPDQARATIAEIGRGLHQLYSG